MPAPPCGNYGDINGNGRVDVGDLTIVTNYVADPVANPIPAHLIERADVDGDGQVTQNDVDLISQYVVGDITSFPVCGSAERVISVVVPAGAVLKIDGVEII